MKWATWLRNRDPLNGMGEVGQQTSLVALERAGGVDDRLETGVGGPEVPAPPVALGPSSALVLPEVAHALLDAHALAVFKSVSRREAKRPRWRLGRFSCAYSHSYFDPARDLSPSAMRARFSCLRTVSTALPR